MAASGERWALLIGIDFYHRGQMRKDEHGHTIHYPSLHGCCNDVQLVRHVLENMGLPKDHIITLLARNPTELQHGASAGETGGQSVTREAILSAMDKVTKSARPGDSVYIHYSGHGGRVRTVYSELKGKHAYDEAIVPSDVELPGGKYIRDVEVAALLQKMVDKKLAVTVAIDSCHSGGATRSDGGVATRGIGVIDHTVLDNDKLNLIDISVGGEPPTRDAHGQQCWLLDPRGYAYLSACCVAESAHEIRHPNGRIHGVFTSCLVEALRRCQGVVTHEDLHGQVSALVHSYFPDQTPLIEGDAGRLFFSGTNGPCRSPIMVTSVESSRKKVTLDAGHLHGVNIGEEYAVYSGKSDADSPLATARVTEVEDLTSSADLTLVSAGEEGLIVPGCELVLIKGGLQKAVLVRLIPNETLKHNPEHDIGLQRIKNLAAKDDNYHFKWQISALNNDCISFLVRINDNIEYELQDPGNYRLQFIPPLPVSDPDSAAALCNYIAHITKYRRVKRLTAAPSHSSLVSTRFELLGAGKGKLTPPELPALRCDADDLRQPSCNHPYGPHQVRDGELVRILFRNIGSVPLYLTVFDLKPSWGIAKIYPSGAGNSEEVPAGEDRLLQFQMVIPSESSGSGENRFTDHLKAIVTLHETSLTSLELPSIGKEDIRYMHAGNRGAELEELLEELAICSRDAEYRTGKAVGAYHTHDIMIEILRSHGDVKGDASMTGNPEPRVISMTDPDDLLAEYIRWYKTIAPHQEAKLDKALAALRKDSHDLGTLKDMRDSDWTGLGIELGLGRRLARDIVKFESFCNGAR